MKKEDIITIGNGGIEYQLLTNEKDSVTVYGIKIECTLFGEKETFVHDDVTTDCETARELMNLLADYVVLPCTALEVINEYVDAKARINL